MLKDYGRLIGVIAVSVMVSPSVFRWVSGAIESWLVATDLSVWNPGNATGMIVGVAGTCGVVFAIAGVMRALHHLDDKRRRRMLLHEGRDWIAAVAVGLALVVGTYRLVAYLHSVQVAAILSIFVAALVAGMIARWKFPPYAFDPYVSGPRVKSADEVKRSRGNRPVTCAPHGADWIAVDDEVRHYLILGKVGGGKTTQLKMVMSALAPVPGLWAVADPKIEMVPFLEALGRRPIIVNPYDRRRVRWAMDTDIVNPALAMSMAATLVPLSKEAREPHFTETGQEIVRGGWYFFDHLKKTTGRPWDLRDLVLLCSNKELMKQAFARLPQTRPLLEYLKDGIAEQNPYLSTVTTALRSWRIIAALWSHATESFSMTELVEQAADSYDAIVYAYDHEAGQPLQELNRLLFEIQKQRVMNLPDDKSRRIRWFIDEVSKGSHHLGRSLTELLAMGRSKGACLYLGSQDTAGLIQSFGKEGLAQLWGLSQHRVVVGGVDGETAKYISEMIGDITYIETDTSFSKSKPTATEEVGSAKAPDQGKDVSVQFTIKTRPAVPKEQLAEEFPLTTPETGVTGCFIGGRGGLHWYTAEWDEINALTVRDDPTVSAYDRIPRESDEYYLKPFTDEELNSLGLTKGGSHHAD